MAKKDLHNMPNIPTVEMIKCEGCNGYHPLEDCEVVVIRVIKGKACPMPSAAEKTQAPFVPRVEPMNAREDAPLPPPQDVPKRPAPPRKNIIPPAMAAMMIPPTHPGFESHGAKEFRTA